MSLAAADEEKQQVLLSDDVLNELLCSDDVQYLESLCSGFGTVTYIPAGSMVEGGYLARNVRDHTVWEVERDWMRVMACIRSPDSGVLVEVGEEHVHVRCPHTGIYIIPGDWEWLVRESCTSLPAGDTHDRQSYINGRELLQGYSRRHHVQGPSAASTEPSGAVRELDLGISEWTRMLTRYRYTLPVTNCLTQLYQCARDMREWLTDNGLTHDKHRVRMVARELLDSLSSVIATGSSRDQLQGSTSEEERQVRQLLMSHLERGVEIMKMCRTHETDVTRSDDKVPAIECLFWPRQAEAWINRPGRLWPPQEVIEQVVSQGFHLVSKERHINPSERDFRISFALSEQIIARLMCDGQKKAWFILKMIYYRYLKCIGPSDDSLKSYACKTVMLWVCEQHAVTWWEENSTLTTVTCLLTHLLECLVKGEMRHYFLPEVNLFHGWNTPPAVLEECAAKIFGWLDSNRLLEMLCADSFDILAHRLLVQDSGYKGYKGLLFWYGEMKTSIVELLSVYCDVAQSVVLPSALDHTDITTLHQLVATATRAAYYLPATMSARRVSQFVGRMWGQQAHTSLYDKVRSGGASDGRSYREMLHDAWWRRGFDGLLWDVWRFMYDIDHVCKYEGEYVSTVHDMCHYMRQVVHVLCAPHVLLDAKLLCYDDEKGKRYKSLDDNQVITHFVSVIQGATRAARMCELYLDECVRQLELA